MTSATRLLVISGPIAAGKTAVASALAATFRDSGRSVAVVDLDRLYMMLDDRPPMNDPSHSREARRAAAALTDHFVLDGIELVIVEGTFWTMSEREEFAAALTTPVQPIFVTLQVSVEQALRRVQADSGRRASRNPAILRASHAAFGAVTPISTDAIIDSSSLTADAVTVALIAALEHLTAPERHAALFKDIDCLQIPVPDLKAALDFYRGALGHALIWRTSTAAGLQMADSASEIVVQSERPELEANVSVTSADAAAVRFVEAGGTLIAPPFDIRIGRCAVMKDPWGNRLVVLDHSRGGVQTNTNRGLRA